MPLLDVNADFSAAGEGVQDEPVRVREVEAERIGRVRRRQGRLAVAAVG